MPAAVEVQNGQEAFASFREPAWHGLGTVFTDEVTSAFEMGARAHLNGWNVRSEPAQHGAARFVVPTFHIVRDNPFDGGLDVLGTSGERYEVVQNEDALSLFDGHRFETAGSINGGRTVFATVALDREIVLDPSGVSDVVKTLLLVATSHDGSLAIRGGATPIRVVCANTLNAALPGLEQSFTIKHTRSAQERLAAVKRGFALASNYFDGFEHTANQMMSQAVVDQKFREIVETLFPRPEDNSKGRETKWESRVALNMAAWNDPKNAGIKNTAWGAWNALTEANQWGRKIQDTPNGQENFYKAGAGFDKPTNDFRTKSLQVVQALA